MNQVTNFCSFQGLEIARKLLILMHTVEINMHFDSGHCLPKSQHCRMHNEVEMFSISLVSFMEHEFA